VEIHVLQGERAMARDNRTIGKFHLDGIPPAMRGVPQIEVSFDIDANGIIHVSATDKGTGKLQSIRIESSSGLSKEEIEKMKMEAEKNAESDKQLKEDADTLNSADSLIFRVNSSLKDLEGKITDEERSDVESSVNKLKEAFDRKDVSEVKTLTEEVNNKFQTISQKLYSQSNSDDEVTDQDFENVDYQEVK
jgi:molecular chaperone DnaK